jgi:hypothetical protein
MFLVPVVFAGVGELGPNPFVTYPADIDSPTTDNVAYQQPFVNPPLNGLGFAAYYSWMLADDFELTQHVDIASLELWAIYAGGNATSIKVQFRANSSNTPGAVIWEQTSTTLAHAFTGYQAWGYNLMHTGVTLAQPYFWGNAATRYWLSMQTVGGSAADYWLAGAFAAYTMNYFSQDNGSTWTSSQSAWGTAYDSYFVLIQSPTGLDRTTWGDIKTSF